MCGLLHLFMQNYSLSKNVLQRVDEKWMKNLVTNLYACVFQQVRKFGFAWQSGIFFY